MAREEDIGRRLERETQECYGTIVDGDGVNVARASSPAVGSTTICRAPRRTAGT